MVHPSEVAEALTEDRLQLLARTIGTVRSDLTAIHSPEKGDDAWTFGCLAYRRSCFALERLARSGDCPWLEVKLEGLACTIVIGGVALKFYRGEAEKPAARTLRKGLDELLQERFAFYGFELDSSEGDWLWMMAIETHLDGTVARVAFFQANAANETRHLYLLPTDASVAAASVVTPVERPGVELSPPVVRPKAPPGSASGTDGGADGNG